MGLEKVIEKLEEVPPMLRLLIGSATGQLITTYVNMSGQNSDSGTFAQDTKRKLL